MVQPVGEADIRLYRSCKYSTVCGYHTFNSSLNASKDDSEGPNEDVLNGNLGSLEGKVGHSGQCLCGSWSVVKRCHVSQQLSEVTYNSDVVLISL